jgi:ribosomal protein L11 methyltransferase
MYQVVVTHCQNEEVDLLEELMEEMGALSVTLTDRYDSPILEPEIGTTPLWSDVVIQALFADAKEAQHVRDHLTSTYAHLQVILEIVPEKDWERVCLDEFIPLQFGKRLWICPSWLTPPEPEAVNITLDPGLAFGTGTHPTTSLCLTWLDQADLQDKRVIDYGCGSGILAIAALKLGASHATAIDLDEQALSATRNNASCNHLPESSLTVSFPSELHAPADVLIANILLTPLLQLQHKFRDLLKPEGILVVSGILNDQVQSLIDAYAPEWVNLASVSQEDWSLLVFKPAVTSEESPH